MTTRASSSRFQAEDELQHSQAHKSDLAKGRVPATHEYSPMERYLAETPREKPWNIVEMEERNKRK